MLNGGFWKVGNENSIKKIFNYKLYKFLIKKIWMGYLLNCSKKFGWDFTYLGMCANGLKKA